MISTPEPTLYGIGHPSGWRPVHLLKYLVGFHDNVPVFLSRAHLTCLFAFLISNPSSQKGVHFPPRPWLSHLKPPKSNLGRDFSGHLSASWAQSKFSKRAKWSLTLIFLNLVVSLLPTCTHLRFYDSIKASNHHGSEEQEMNSFHEFIDVLFLRHS